MKTCCLVWEIPVIEGEHYNPIVNVIYMQKAKKFLNQLNRYFQDKNMDWKCVLDRSACTYNEIFSSEKRFFIPAFSRFSSEKSALSARKRRHISS